MWFPIPKLLIAYVEARGMAFTQLTTPSVRNMVVTIVTADTPKFFVEITRIVWNSSLAGTELCGLPSLSFYLPIPGKLLGEEGENQSSQPSVVERKNVCEGDMANAEDFPCMFRGDESVVATRNVDTSRNEVVVEATESPIQVPPPRSLEFAKEVAVLARYEQRTSYHGTQIAYAYDELLSASCAEKRAAKEELVDAFVAKVVVEKERDEVRKEAKLKKLKKFVV
ncbi:unnamed protein product [Cochlearia groenlandica]